MDSSHLSFILLMNLWNYKVNKNSLHAAKSCAYINTYTHTESVFTKARLHLSVESVSFQPATTHEAKCLFHDHVGRAGDQKKNYQQPDSHTIIHDIIPINAQSRKRKRRNENNKVESGLDFKCYVLLFILFVAINFKPAVFLYFSTKWLWCWSTQEKMSRQFQLCALHIFNFIDVLHELWYGFDRQRESRVGMH